MEIKVIVCNSVMLGRGRDRFKSCRTSGSFQYACCVLTVLLHFSRGAGKASSTGKEEINPQRSAVKGNCHLLRVSVTPS